MMGSRSRHVPALAFIAASLLISVIGCCAAEKELDEQAPTKGMAAIACNCDLPFSKTPNKDQDVKCGLTPSTWQGCRSPKEWKTRSIYQVLTDRFASDDSADCGDWLQTHFKYCGGTWKAMKDRLPYIQKLGFNAIWISPIPLNAFAAYHGYAAENLYEANPQYGTAKELKELVDAAHDMDIWVMVDIVANHMSARDAVSSFYPFNQGYHYHDRCDINFNKVAGGCQYEDVTSVQKCRLSGLLDLNQDNDWVEKQLIKWFTCIMPAFGFDGVRVDTVPEVHPKFWGKLTESLPNCHLIGEVFEGCMGLVQGYEYKSQDKTGLPGLMHYPLYYEINKAFGVSDSKKFYDYRLQWLAGNASVYAKSANVDVWGTFIDNHDNPRFLNSFIRDANEKYKIPLLHNALTWLMLHRGIPIVYYGTEQQYEAKPWNQKREKITDVNTQCTNQDHLCDSAWREPLWSSKYDTNGETFRLLANLNKARKAAQVWNHPVKEWWRAQGDNDDLYAFTRGSVLALVSNRPWQTFTRTFKVGFGADGIPPNSNICNILSGCTDCVSTDSQGSATFTLGLGETKVYLPGCRVALQDNAHGDLQLDGHDRQANAMAALGAVAAT